MNLYDIASAPESQRDEDWEKNFFDTLVSGHLELIEEDPQSGPDGWPYLFVRTSRAAEEPAKNILHWASEHGVGVAINPDKHAPDMVLSYGMVWNFRQRAQFITPMEEPIDSGEVVFNKGQKIIFAEPSEEYLPGYVREILKTFFKDQKVDDAKIVLVSADEGKTFDLVFSQESLDITDEKEFDGILQAISWFLPTHYSLVIASEENFSGFKSL